MLLAIFAEFSRIECLAPIVVELKTILGFWAVFFKIFENYCSTKNYKKFLKKIKIKYG